MLSAIGGIDLTNSNLVVFNHVGYVPQLPLAFFIQVHVLNRLIHWSIIDEGEFTCIMSMNYWKSLGSPHLSQSPTTLKYFDGHTYKHCGILSNLQVKLGGKMFTI